MQVEALLGASEEPAAFEMDGKGDLDRNCVDSCLGVVSKYDLEWDFPYDGTQCVISERVHLEVSMKIDASVSLRLAVVVVQGVIDLMTCEV